MPMPSSHSCTIALALGILSQGYCADALSVEAGPLSVRRLNAAAETAGFKVIENKSVIPVAAYSRLPFVASGYDDERLTALRKAHRLEQVTAPATDEWTAQLLLKEWVCGKIPLGNPKSQAVHALDILEKAARGETFYCTHYAITYAECAAALGWQARKLGIDRPHGKDGFGSSHHGVAEIWSNQFAKWVAIDANFNLHYEKQGAPLSAWEIRAEWLKNQGADVDRVTGAGPRAVKKKLGRATWHFREDETASYFWNYIDNRVVAADRGDSADLIFLQDAANDSAVWYQNHDSRTQQSRLHTGYLKNTFVPTRRLEDAYWTVGVVDATLTRASARSIWLKLKSYCPNQLAFERSVDRFAWTRIEDEQSVEWPLKAGWNTLVLRTLGRGNVTGPETTLLLFLE
jgi:hypothetical protein